MKIELSKLELTDLIRKAIPAYFGNMDGHEVTAVEFKHYPTEHAIFTIANVADKEDAT